MSEQPLILVTVGTDHHPFDRLVEWLDRWLGTRRGPPLRCLVQHGSSRSPAHAEGAEMLPFDRLRELCAEASVIVCQGGPGSVALARELGRRPIVVPRSAALGEHVDDHQIPFARRLDREGVAVCAEREADLHAALTRALAEPGWLRTDPGPSPEIGHTVARFGAIAEELLAEAPKAATAARRPPTRSRRPRPLETLHRLRYLKLAGFTAEEYELFGLRGQSRRRTRAYASSAQMHNLIRPALNDPRYTFLLDDKWVFARLLDSFSIPAPRTLGLLEPLTGRTWDGQPLRDAGDLEALLAAEQPEAIVIKPVAGLQATGVRFAELAYGDRELDVRLDGASTNIGELVADLEPRAFGGVGGHLIQERLTQHPQLAALMPETTNTLRVRTLVRADGSVVVLRAALRIGRAGSRVESFRAGGLNVWIADLSGGELGEGETLAGFGDRFHRRHPDTGAPISGTRVPCWEQVLELSRRVARVVPQVRAVGWDVAITPEGPVVIEGNADWDPVQTGGAGFLDRVVRDELAAAGVSRPEAEPTVGMALRRLRGRLGRRVLAGIDRHLRPAPAREGGDRG